MSTETTDQTMTPAQPDQRLSDAWAASRKKFTDLVAQLTPLEDRLAKLEHRLNEDKAAEIVRGEPAPTAAATLAALKQAERDVAAHRRAVELQREDADRCERAVKDSVADKFIPSYRGYVHDVVSALIELDRVIAAHSDYVHELNRQGVAPAMPILTPTGIVAGRVFETLSPAGQFIDMAKQRGLYVGPLPTYAKPHPKQEA
jgi:predicted RNase H-like nuclease (RuvC/YqgF family)